MLHGGGPGEPQIGGDGVAVGGQGPATGQQGESVPRGDAKDTLKQMHHKGSK